MKALVILGLMAVVILPVSVLIGLGRFDGLYGQDAFAYYDYAVGPLRESLTTFRPWPPFFWPPGYPLLVAALSLVIGQTPLAGQLVSLLAGGLTPLFTALLARELVADAPDPSALNRFPVPWVAGLTVALTGQLWQSSAVVMADTTGLTAATLGVWALARYGRRAAPGWLMLASAALAFATLTRWIYSLVAGPCALYALIILLRQTNRRAALLTGASALLIALVILSPLIGPALAVWAGRASGLVSFVGNLQVHYWNPVHAFRREFDTPDGHLVYSLPNGLYYALAPAHRYYFTPLVALVLLPGLWAAWQKRSREWSLLIGGWAAVVYVYHAGDPWQNFRFTLAYLPPLAILAALGAGVLAERWRSWLWAGLAVGWGAMAWGGWQLTHGFILRKADEVSIVQRVEAQLPDDARLITFNLTSMFRHYSALETIELYDLRADDVAALLSKGHPMYLLMDVNNVETQWANTPLSQTYQWMRASPGLKVLDQFGAYTLFRVQPSGPAP